MAAPVTPRKHPKCFCCLSSDPYRVYEINGHFWKKEDLSNAIEGLLWSGCLSDVSIGICNRCVKKVKDSCAVVQQLKENILRSTSSQQKRYVVYCIQNLLYSKSVAFTSLLNL